MFRLARTALRLLSDRRNFLLLALAAITMATPGKAQTPAEWAEVVAAARKEGEVIVWSQAGEERRKLLKDAFEKDNPGITVRLFQAGSSSQRDSRFLQELKAGVFKADVFAGGGGSALARLMPQNMLRPIKPLLRPETLRPDKWLTSTPPWVDNKKEYMISAGAQAYPSATANAEVSGVTRWDDLLDTKWNGKIVMLDPRKSGSGFAFTVFLYNEPSLGIDYMRKFFAGGRVVFASDDRQQAEWVDNGRALIGINVRATETEALQSVGGKLKVLDDLTNGAGEKVAAVVDSDGIVYLPNLDPLPHPNAARVYVNWFYSKEGQQALVDNIGIGSNHAEVDQRKVSKWLRPRPGVRFVNVNTEDVVNEEAASKMRKIVAEIIGQK